MNRRGVSGRLTRIAHVTFGLDVGGQEKLLVEFARQTDRREFDLDFISLGLRGRLADEVEVLGRPVSALGAPSGLRPGLIVKLSSIFRASRPDVVHTHDQRALFYAGPAARLSGVPIIVHTRHGRDNHATARQMAIFRRLASLVDRFVCVSDEVAELSRAQGIEFSRVHIIKNGIDVNRFSACTPDLTGPAVTVARLSPEKDVANLVRAIAQVADSVPDLNVEVAGDGPCLLELEQLANNLGLVDRIRFLGEVHDVASLLARARLFVLPSRSEGIPLTALEAMACGLPVVATRVGGLPEVVVDGVTGLLVPPTDSSALSDALVAIWNDPDTRGRMGRAGRLRCHECFDVERMVSQYEALYRDAISGRQCSRSRRDMAGATPKLARSTDGVS
jgi:glycosyltransferase involved in cell wall biosynthesis